MLFSRPYSYASLRLKFQISTCERAYSLRAVWPAEEGIKFISFNMILIPILVLDLTLIHTITLMQTKLAILTQVTSFQDNCLEIYSRFVRERQPD